MLESRIEYRDQVIDIWTSIDPEIFRRPDDRRIKNVTNLSPNLFLVNSRGEYEVDNVEETALCLSKLKPETFFRFRVENTVFYKKTRDYFAGDQNEYLMSVGNLRELCHQLGINYQE